MTTTRYQKHPCFPHRYAKYCLCFPTLINLGTQIGYIIYLNRLADEVSQLGLSTNSTKETPLNGLWKNREIKKLTENWLDISELKHRRKKWMGGGRLEEKKNILGCPSSYVPDHWPLLGLVASNWSIPHQRTRSGQIASGGGAGDHSFWLFRRRSFLPSLAATGTASIVDSRFTHL